MRSWGGNPALRIGDHRAPARERLGNQDHLFSGRLAAPTPPALCPEELPPVGDRADTAVVRTGLGLSGRGAPCSQ